MGAYLDPPTTLHSTPLVNIHYYYEGGFSLVGHTCVEVTVVQGFRRRGVAEFRSVRIGPAIWVLGWHSMKANECAEPRTPANPF